jgi:peptide/nickel transport system permease protein
MSWPDLLTVALVVLLLALAVVGPWLAPHDPNAVSLRETLRPPSAEHWLGTDGSGRDVLSRVLTGARASIFGATGTVLAAALIGVVIAALAALSWRFVDEAIMRLCDIALSLPVMVLALGIAVALGPSQRSAIVAMVLASWPSFVRFTRAEIRQVMTAPYVESARVLGVSRWRLMVRHVLPNSLDTVLVKAAMDIASAILIISSLSFIGAGAQPPSAEWGAMVTDGRRFLSTTPWLVAVPGVAIVLTAVGFSLLGDVLRTRLDPSLEVVGRRAR